ncbi:MAG: homoserine dehydrogenase [Bacillota bacterium]
MKKIGVAILGLGTVGGGTYEILTKNKEYYQRTQCLDVVVENVMELRQDRCDLFNVPKEARTTNLMEVISNPNVDIVVEVIGGCGFAKEAVERSLSAGKCVVTANKELLAKHFYELEAIAKKNNCGLYYEASCVGGVPIIRTLHDGTQANNIESIKGIINGTTNYILSKMSDDGASYADVLAEAQKLGYAEANPSADVDGFDAAYKLSILSSLAFQTKVPLECIYREGIADVKIEDIEYGKHFGYTMKLLGIAKRAEKGIEARVHPTFIKNDDLLSSVKGSFNAVSIVGDSVGEVMLYGRGAGDLPTGSAIVSDILYAGKKLLSGHGYTSFGEQSIAEATKKIATDFKCEYYIRLKVKDELGVLAKVGSIFEKSSVSMREVIQKSALEDGDVQLVITTHKTQESKIQKAIAKLENTSGIVSFESLIRIEE